MGRRGRKRQPGKRERNGRLQRGSYLVVGFDKGSDWVQAQRERFGEHYGSAIGRAFASGLLGEDMEAKNRLDAGKRFSRLYRAVVGGDAYRCALNPDPRSAGQRTAFQSHPHDKESQDWLFEAMDKLDRAGLRPWLNMMLSTENTDRGPVWMDRLLMGGRDPYDRAMLKQAIAALDVIAPPAPVACILSIAS